MSTAPWGAGDDPFKEAVREAVKARIALTGPAGSGKTFTALAIATELAERVAVVDTEHGRALEYAGQFKFRHFAPNRFDPRELCTLLAQAAHHGYDGVVLDSMSHYWMGAGGALEIVDGFSTKPGGNMSGWKEYGPIERRMVDAILAYPGHIIATMRVKTAYALEQDERGKNVVRKVGLEPDQRKGMDYEFSVIGEIDRDHRMAVTKSTCPALVDTIIDRPGADVADTLRKWIDGGAQLPDALEYRVRALDKGCTFADLRVLHSEVKDRGLLGAMVLDEDGNDSTLGDLIVRVGRERKPVSAVAA